MNQVLEVFRTRNLQVSAFLVARGQKFLRCEPTGHNYCDFLFFDPSGEVAALAETYYEGETCKALLFYRALLDLKTEIRRALPDTGVSRG